MKAVSPYEASPLRPHLTVCSPSESPVAIVRVALPLWASRTSSPASTWQT